MEDNELRKELTAINDKLNIIIVLLSKENDDDPKPPAKEKSKGKVKFHSIEI